MSSFFPTDGAECLIAVTPRDGFPPFGLYGRIIKTESKPGALGTNFLTDVTVSFAGEVKILDWDAVKNKISPQISLPDPKEQEISAPEKVSPKKVSKSEQAKARWQK